MVKQYLKKILLKITPQRIMRLYQEESVSKITKYTNYSYSQEGEDLLLERFLEQKKNGFYIDVGAHHPQRFSNTFYFYKKGWSGINIDAMPGSMKAFNEIRPRDINLELGVSSTKGELLYYIFNEPALNTFSKEEATKKDGLRNFKVINTKKIKTFPLSSILEEYLPENIPVDFMSVDVEGLDLQVIQSNDWTRFRPQYILIEDLKRKDISNIIKESILYKYLNELGYSLVAKTFNTLFFKDTTVS